MTEGGGREEGGREVGEGRLDGYPKQIPGRTSRRDQSKQERKLYYNIKSAGSYNVNVFVHCSARRSELNDKYFSVHIRLCFNSAR